MASEPHIPFNIPYLTGEELVSIEVALSAGKIHGDGELTQQCQQWFVENFGAASAHLTASCTIGLDMVALVAGFSKGDEVLVPDYTFVSSAQCVALRGATPVLCDIRTDTLNIDEGRLEEALTANTRGIIPVHYAGVSAEMDAISAFAEKHGLIVIEDAAQAIGCTYNDKPVGAQGDMSVFSFHSTKNIHCGEGGMVVVNNPDYSEACEIAWEKGTDRRKFMEGHVEKYQWQQLGSSFLASEITAAMLLNQLHHEESINNKRRAIWRIYEEAFAGLSEQGKIQIPSIPNNVSHNGHMFFVVLPTREARSALIKHLESNGIKSAFHYTPLHESAGGKTYCKQGMTLDNSAALPHRLLRLPLYPDLTRDMQEKVIEAVSGFAEKL